MLKVYTAQNGQRKVAIPAEEDKLSVIKTILAI